MDDDRKDSPEEDSSFTERVERARKVHLWKAPPKRVVDAVVSADLSATPGPVENPSVMSWQPADVRSGAAVGDSGHVISEVFEEGELGLTADPPVGGGTRKIRGKIWLRDSDAGSSTVLLLQDDHVIATVEARNGEAFTIDDVLAPGWTVEVHLPTGKTVRIVDPKD